ncbi:MAG: type IV toxin-antitoxin system AbiEi family antitoxin [Salinarimonas sp.]|nr:type IV toxin-antitoxin system AbiEi family antitoxin [Salinarimonas sp.]
MTSQNRDKLNLLLRSLPDGLVVDSRWMEAKDYSSSLRSQYVAAGWLVQPARGVYMRPGGRLSWQNVVISMQTLLEMPVIVGGRTALELHGFAHYLAAGRRDTVHLYGLTPPPGWLARLPLNADFVFHRIGPLFGGGTSAQGSTAFAWNTETDSGFLPGAFGGSPKHEPFTGPEWPLTVSRPERAFLELLDELPTRESFDNADMIAQGLQNLRPGVMQRLLESCRSIKVKRLCFWLAERHGHGWLRHIDRSRISLGSGKRVLAKGGRLDPTYLITVPEGMDEPV